jgi:hypothetical protein
MTSGGHTVHSEMQRIKSLEVSLKLIQFFNWQDWNLENGICNQKEADLRKWTKKWGWVTVNNIYCSLYEIKKN